MLIFNRVTIFTGKHW